MSSKGAEHLAHHVLARRTQLDFNQLDVHAAGGPSNTLLTTIENGRLEALTRSTAHKLDRGLLWEPGSARRVWDGGEPVPLGRASSMSPTRRAIFEDPDLDDETRAALLALLDARQTPPQPPHQRHQSA